jgi:hypothetical protein
MQSLNNTSNVPLRANAIFIGSWDDILKYQNVQVSLNADSNCEIIYYTSNDKIYIENTTFSYVSGSNYFNSINSTSRYVYFTVRNTTNVDQTSFSLSILYKSFPITNGGGISENVSIIGPLNGDGSVFVGGDLTLSGDVNANITNTSLDVNVLNPVDSVDANITNTSLDVNVLNPVDSVDANITNASLDVNVLNPVDSVDANITNASLDVNVLNPVNSVDINNFPATQNVSDADTHTKLDSVITDLNKFIFNGNNLNTQVNNTVNVSDSDSHTSLTNINNNLNKFNKSSSVLWLNSSTGVNGVSLAVNLTAQNQYNLTFYGNVSGASVLTVQFSYDNNTYYDSQYSFNSSAGGDVGFTIQSSPNYVRLKSSLDVTATMFLVAN